MSSQSRPESNPVKGKSPGSSAEYTILTRCLPSFDPALLPDEEQTSPRAQSAGLKPPLEHDATLDQGDSEDELDLLASADSMDEPPSVSPSKELRHDPTQAPAALPIAVSVNNSESKQFGGEDSGMESEHYREARTNITHSPKTPSQDAPATVSPQAVFIPSTSSPSLQQTPRSSIVIPTPSEPALSMGRYNLELPPQPDIPQMTATPALHHTLKSDYPLPPLQSLPPEFNRKKSTKRKKDRDRSDKSQKDDILPMGINRWNAMLSANPVYKRMSKSAKCLSSKDWSVSPPVYHTRAFWN
jgi:chromatin modification-related protein VID21